MSTQLRQDRFMVNPYSDEYIFDSV